VEDVAPVTAGHGEDEVGLGRVAVAELLGAELAGLHAVAPEDQRAERVHGRVDDCLRSCTDQPDQAGILAEQLVQVRPAELLRQRGPADVPGADEKDGEETVDGRASCHVSVGRAVSGRHVQLAPLPGSWLRPAATPDCLLRFRQVLPAPKRLLRSSGPYEGHMTLVLIIALAWTALALPVALAIGRCLRIADRRELARTAPTVPDFIPVDLLESLTQAPNTTPGRRAA
jgi:hypothetical protein